MAFFRRPKLPSKKAPTKPWTNDELKVVGWCMNKNIHVGITPDWKHPLIHWQIHIEIKDKVHVDTKRYDSRSVLNKKLEYYKYYYEKYNKTT